MLEIENPLAVRREVSFCESVSNGHKTVEDVKAVRAIDPDEIKKCWENVKWIHSGSRPATLEPQCNVKEVVHIVVDKKNSSRKGARLR